MRRALASALGLAALLATPAAAQPAQRFGGPQQTRLCGVHVDGETLRPIQHPWWASRAGAIDEARLARRGERVVALYRDGASLREADVTEGGWGQEVDAPRDHGALAPTETFLLPSDAQSEVQARQLH